MRRGCTGDHQLGLAPLALLSLALCACTGGAGAAGLAPGQCEVGADCPGTQSCRAGRCVEPDGALLGDVAGRSSDAGEPDASAPPQRDAGRPPEQDLGGAPAPDVALPEDCSPRPCAPALLCQAVRCSGVQVVCVLTAAGWQWDPVERACDDGDPCTLGDRCRPGACVGEPIRCVDPPAPTCTDEGTLRRFEQAGSCQNGHCIYAASDSPCGAGCVDGACLGEPCAGVVCDAPPEPHCADGATLIVHSLPGECLDGVCSYPSEERGCAGGCQDGRCLDDPCAGVSCEVPPQPTCNGPDIARAFVAPGDCVAGACQYSHVDTPCPHGCAGGQCNPDPCLAMRCDPGEVCADGLCRCGGDGPDCVGGDLCCGSRCVDAATDASNCGACGATCDVPPADGCHGDELRTHDPQGRCAAGQCSFDALVLECGQCSAGRCGAVDAERCVPGSAASCINSGGTWTGGACCMPNVSVCTDGSAASCINSGGRWTGDLCCMPDVALCTEGSAASCLNSGGRWTGDLCCVQGRTSCAEGNAAACLNAGAAWTGRVCCR